MKPKAFILFLAAATAGSLFAQEGTHWVGLQYAYVKPNSSDLYGNGAYGAGVGTWLTDTWGVEVAALDWVLNPTDKTYSGGHETHYFLSSLFGFCPKAAFNPFVRLGVGATSTPAPWSGQGGSARNPNLFGGVGIQSTLKGPWYWNGELRGVAVGTPHAHYEYMALVGLGYRLGAEAPPAPATVP